MSFGFVALDAVEVVSDVDSEPCFDAQEVSMDDPSVEPTVINPSDLRKSLRFI
jgi:hypothetical protein